MGKIKLAAVLFFIYFDLNACDSTNEKTFTHKIPAEGDENFSEYEFSTEYSSNETTSETTQAEVFETCGTDESCVMLCEDEYFDRTSLTKASELNQNHKVLIGWPDCNGSDILDDGDWKFLKVT
jgi:hypothetical protein